MQPRLTIELVPSSCWYSNVRSNVRPQTWDQLQDEYFAAAHHKCEICGGRGPHHPVELHEIWAYDDHRCIQRLSHLATLCPRCHQVKHIGLAIAKQNAQSAIEWLAHVNQWTDHQAVAYVLQCIEEHKIRSQFNWTLDLQLLQTKHRIQLTRSGIEAGL